MSFLVLAPSALQYPHFELRIRKLRFRISVRLNQAGISNPLKEMGAGTVVVTLDSALFAAIVGDTGAGRNDQATPGSSHRCTITITATPTTDATQPTSTAQSIHAAQPTASPSAIARREERHLGHGLSVDISSEPQLKVVASRRRR